MASTLNKFVGIARTRKADKSGSAIIDLNVQIEGHKVEIQLVPTTTNSYDAKMQTGDGRLKTVGSAKRLNTRHMGQPEIIMTFSQNGAQLRLSPQMQDASGYMVFILPPATPPTPPTVKAAKAAGVPTSIKAKVTPLQKVTAALVEAAASVNAIGTTKVEDKKARAAKLDDLRAAKRGVEKLLSEVDGQINAERLRSFTGGK